MGRKYEMITEAKPLYAEEFHGWYKHRAFGKLIMMRVFDTFKGRVIIKYAAHKDEFKYYIRESKRNFKKIERIELKEILKIDKTKLAQAIYHGKR